MLLEKSTIIFQDAIYTGFLKSDKYLKQLKKRMSVELDFGGEGNSESGPGCLLISSEIASQQEVF